MANEGNRWHDDPLEVDRYLDGECTDDERAARAADLDRDAALRQRVDARRAFLDALSAHGEARRASLRARMPAGLPDRVTSALRRPRVPWMRYAAAAVLVLGVGVALSTFATDDVEAIPPAVLDAARIAEDGFDAREWEELGCVEGETNPYTFPPVRLGELSVGGCRMPGSDDGKTAARLEIDLGETTSVGYVAVPEKGTRQSADVGKTVLGDVVVYDILYGRTRYYLAVRADVVKERGDCAACHNKSREGQKNPHRIELRAWRRR